MHSNQAVAALRREKALLEHVLALAECQLELLQSGRLEDFAALLSLRARPMTEMAQVEGHISIEMPQIQNGLLLTTHEMREMRLLNLQIIDLANRIVEVDERANQLAELVGSQMPPQNPAQSEAY